jgi:hypothetical protein
MLAESKLNHIMLEIYHRLCCIETTLTISLDQECVIGRIVIQWVQRLSQLHPPPFHIEVSKALLVMTNFRDFCG